MTFWGGQLGNLINQYAGQRGMQPQMIQPALTAGSMGRATREINDMFRRGIAQPMTETYRQDPSLALKQTVLGGMGGTESLLPKGVPFSLEKGLNINTSLTPGKETTLDAIPHTLKQGSSVTPQQADYFLNEYSSRPFVGSTVKDFLAGSPSFQQKINFILSNF